MKIYFSPEFSGKVFLKPDSNSNVMMDTAIANTIGLLNMLELRLGLHYQEVDEGIRIANYYDAMHQYLKSHPDNVFKKSFDIAGLATAKALLGWRDELRMAQLDFDGEDISDRLKTIIGIEEIFRKNDGCDLAGRLHIATDQIDFQKLDCSEMEVIVPCDVKIMKPCVRQLLEAMKRNGAKITLQKMATDTDNNLSRIRNAFMENAKGEIALNADDESLLIYKFADKHAANQYFAYNDIDADVWINADNKQMDNWLGMMGKALTGSMQNDCLPQLSQMFVTGVGLFYNPLNVNTLIDWLNMPIHPLNGWFRKVLAGKIVKTGGYRNAECKAVIEDFIDGEFEYLTDEQKMLSEEEQQKIREHGRKSRMIDVEIYLPPMAKQSDIKVVAVQTFVKKLAGWARQKSHLLSESGENPQWVEQLSKVAAMADAFGIILNTYDAQTIDYKTIDSWLSAIVEKSSFTNAIAEQGCRIVVDSPAKMASNADTAIWLDVDGDDSKRLECSFLFPNELKQLIEKQYIKHWDEDSENQYRQQIAITPLLYTQNQLILVVCERRNGEATHKHPLIVRLEQQLSETDLNAITREPQIEPWNLMQIDKIDNSFNNKEVLIEDESGAEETNVTEPKEVELHFDNADKIQWPDHLSPTVIDTLVNYPFDYLMNYLLDIQSDGMAAMSDVRTVKGTVAHAIIEKLFSPRGDNGFTTAAEAENRIKTEFEDVYSEMIEAKGAILQLPENKLDEKLLHEQMEKCLVTLVNILKNNNLKVTSCERHITADINLGLPKSCEKDAKDYDTSGNIDMTLEDADGHPVVFDFKWTTSRSYHRRLLEENRSIQLEFYRYMLSKEKHDDVKKVAYFIMPECRLYSLEKFEGPNCIKVEPSNNDNIVAMICNSIRYRIKQLKNGVVEMNGSFDDIEYVSDTEKEHLFPLQKDDETGNKKENIFSDYKIFENN